MSNYHDLTQAEEDLYAVLDTVEADLNPKFAKEIAGYICHREFGLAAEGLIWFIGNMGRAIEPQTLARLRRLRVLTNAHGDFESQAVQ